MNQICVKVAPHEIDEKDPWKDDALKTRRVLGQQLTDLIAFEPNSLSICIDGAWGSGKTFFVERWEKDLKKDGFKVIHFNAWEDDSFDDPMVALVGQLWRDLGLPKSKSELTGDMEQDLKGILRFVGRVTKGVAVHFAEKKWENWTGLDKEALEKIVGDDTSDACKVLEQFEESSRAKDIFRKALANIVKKTVEQTASSTVAKPLVFVVDELDRCRPVFAVQVLERIKHFLSVPRVVFVFCIDKHNLGESLKAVYGEIDVDNYLYRFFDFIFPLTSLDKKSFCNALWSQYDVSGTLTMHDAECHNGCDGLLNKDKTFFECFSFLATFHQLTFREIEYVFRSYLLVLRSETIQHRRIQPQLLVTMLLLRLRNRPLGDKFVKLACSPDEVINELLPAQLDPASMCIPMQLAITILYAFHPWAEENEGWNFTISQATKIIKWTSSLQSSPDQPTTIIATIPDFFPQVMKEWGVMNLRQLPKESLSIENEMRTIFLDGNPLKEYEAIINLMETSPLIKSKE